MEIKIHRTYSLNAQEKERAKKGEKVPVTEDSRRGQGGTERKT